MGEDDEYDDEEDGAEYDEEEEGDDDEESEEAPIGRNGGANIGKRQRGDSD